MMLNVFPVLTVLLLAVSRAKVSAIESEQCTDAVNHVADIFILRDSIGLSLGHVVSSLEIGDADQLQTGSFLNDTHNGEADLSNNIISRMVNLVLGDSNYQRANGSDTRQGNAICESLPLKSGDCYIRFLPEDKVALMDEFVQFIPMSVQVVDAVINTVGFFQELDIPSLLQQLPIPVTLNGFQRRRLEVSRQRLHQRSLELNNNAHVALKEYVSARKEQAYKKDSIDAVSDLHRKLLGTMKIPHEDASKELLQALGRQRLRRREQELDFNDVGQLGNTMLGNLLDYFLDIANFLLEYSETDNIETEAMNSGTCIAYNNETFAISSLPGFPPDVVYDFCNCASFAVAGAPFCPIKSQISGFASSANSKLAYEGLGLLPTTILLFDGLSEQSVAASGDVWVALDVTADISKLSSFAIPGFTADAQTVLSCAGVSLPATTNGAATTSRVNFSPDFGGRVTTKTSVLTDLPQTDIPSTSNKEFVSLMALEESKIDLRIGDEGFFNASLLPGYGTVRLNSDNPICQPSGIFTSGNIAIQHLSTGDLLVPFIQDMSPKSGTQVDYGLTFSDVATEPNIPQSIFLKNQVDLKWLGLNLTGGLTFQYMDENEIIRRGDFESNGCCEGTPCRRAVSPLVDPAVKNGSKPAVNILVDIDQVVTWGTLSFQDVKLSFTYQLFDKPEIFFSGSVLAPGLNWIPATVRIEENSGGSWTASFFSSMMDLVDSYPLSLSGTNNLQPGTDGNIEVLSDWDLFFHVDWESANWVNRVEETVFAQLPVVDTQGVAVTSARTHSDRSGVWEQIMDLGKDVGGYTENVLDVLDSSFLGAGDLLPSLQFLKGILDNGSPNGDSLWSANITAKLNIPDLLNINLALQISDSFLQGDLDNTADLFQENGWNSDFVFGLKSSRDKETKKQKDMYDPFFGCDMISYEYEDGCVQLPDGQEFNCRTKREGYFPEPGCFKESARNLNEIRNLVNDALWFEDTCSVQSNRLDLSALAQGFSVTSPQTVFPFGEETCQITFEIIFPRVTIDGQIELDSTQAISNICLVFDSVNSIVSSLTNFQEEIANRVLDITTGSGTTESCAPLEDRLCDEPVLTSVQGTTSATMACTDDFSSLNLRQMLGAGIFNVDESCTQSFFPPIFDFDLSVDFKTRSHNENKWEGCGPMPISVQRYGKDCCHQTTEPLMQTLLIERLPPQFINSQGTMDVTISCDANIHPEATGMPGFTKGCQDAVTSMSIEENSTLDTATCTKTIERTYILRDDGCAATEQTYLQTITLTDDSGPEWDFFPNDVTLRVFEAYGTAATGFPTAFQKCGVPVDITYVDTVVSTVGDIECSGGFTVLERAFRAVDICGRENVRTQRIRIGNEELPFGPKALSFVYAGEELVMDEVDMASCLIGSDTCGVTGTITDNICATSSSSEFSGYGEYLDERGGSLGDGIMRGTCICEDKHCLKDIDGDGGLYFGSPQVDNAEHACFTAQEETRLTTRGNATTVLINCPGNSTSTCSAVLLKGSNPIYNIFRLQAENLGRFTIQIDVPATSFTLINVASAVQGANVTIDPKVAGIELNDGVDPSRIIWNFPTGVNLMGSSVSRTVPYVFKGTMFNRRGSFQFDAGNAEQIDPTPQLAAFQGQIFAQSIDVRGVRFDCDGHFVGFSEQSCSDPWDTTSKSIGNPDGLF